MDRERCMQEAEKIGRDFAALCSVDFLETKGLSEDEARRVAWTAGEGLKKLYSLLEELRPSDPDDDESDDE